MKKHIVLFFLLLSANFIAAQELLMDTEDVHPPDYIDAQFEGGGFEKFQIFVNEHFNYNKVTKPGKMVASFTVDVDGKIKNIKMTEFIDTESAMEMIRVLNSSPKWIPAKRAGKPVSIEIKYPMVFRRS